jgi:DNA/RNA-binding domain of Phe-tRNA-synthetase-like protein
MRQLAVTGKVCAAFPDLRICVVAVTGFAGGRPWPEVETRLRALEADAAAGWPGSGALRDGEDDPHIASWHAAYRSFGTNPRRVRPSADALRRRLARSGRLPRINPAVDGYNLISATFGVPAGAFDLRQVSGDIMVCLADGTESFTPLGEPETVEHPRPGEVVYLDAAGVLTRHWNHRDAERTKVTADSDRIAFMLETAAAQRFGEVVDAAAESLAGLLRERSESVAVHYITPVSPFASVPS